MNRILASTQPPSLTKKLGIIALLTVFIFSVGRGNLTSQPTNKSKEKVNVELNVKIKDMTYDEFIENYVDDDKRDQYLHIGQPVLNLYLSFGLNYLTGPNDVGAMGIFRVKRVAKNFSFYDLQLHGYYNPGTYEDKANYYLLGRLKKSYIMFDWPRLYDYSTYKVKTSTEEDLDYQLIFDYGYGFFFFRKNVKDLKIVNNMEAALVFDYANSDAYDESIASALLRIGLDLDLEFRKFGSKIMGNFFYEIVNGQGDLNANQSRIEIEPVVYYFLSGKSYYVTIGAIYALYTALPSDTKQSVTSLSIYSAITFKY